MKRLRRFTLVALALLALIAGGGIWYAAEQSERWFTKDLEQLEGPFAVELVAYQRGVLHSEAQTQWQIRVNGQMRTYRVSHEIQHIPLPDGRLATIRSELQPDTAMRTLFAASVDESIPLLVHSTIDWRGDQRHALSAEAQRGTLQGADLLWGGFAGVFDVSDRNRRMEGKIFAPLLLLREPGGASAGIEQLTLEVDLKRPAQDALWRGPVDLEVDRMHSRSASDMIQIQQLQWHTETQVDDTDGLIELNSTLQAGQMRIDPHQVEDVELSFALSRLDTDAVSALFDAWRQWLNAPAQQASSQYTELQRQWQAQRPKLLARAPSVELSRLAGTVDDGEFALHAMLRHDGRKSERLDTLLEAISFELGVQLPHAFLIELITQQQQASIDMLAAMYGAEPGTQTYRDLTNNVVYARVKELLDMGLIVEHEEHWSSRLYLHGGEVKLNDEPADELLLMLLGSWLLQDMNAPR